MATHSPAHHGDVPLSHKLLEYSKAAIATLESLVNHRPDASYAGPPAGRLPPAALRACHGIAFFETVRAGAGVSVTHGWGFVVTRLPHGSSLAPGAHASSTAKEPSQGSSWSAPCFLTIDQVGMGLTLGVSRAHTCVLLWNEAALQQILSGKGLLGMDVHVVAGSDATQHLIAPSIVPDEGSIQYTGNSITSPRPEVSTYTVSEGVMLDCSLSGGKIHVNHHLNQEVYGPAGMNPQCILRTKTDQGLPSALAPPAEFASMYEALAEREARDLPVGTVRTVPPGKPRNGVIHHATASNL